MKRNKLSRRDFLHLSAVTGTGALLAACQLPAAPAGEGGGAAAPPAVTTTVNFLGFSVLLNVSWRAWFLAAGAG